MNDADNYHIATLMESVRHHAGIAARPYNTIERLFHLRQAIAKAQEGLMILMNNEGDLGGRKPERWQAMRGEVVNDNGNAPYGTTIRHKESF